MSVRSTTQRAGLALFGALLLTLAGCSDSTNAATQKSTAASSGAGASSTSALAVLERLRLSLDTTAHYGERRFVAYVSVNGVQRDVEYIEEIWTDGMGGYAITPNQVIQNGGTPDAVFTLIQKNREGFVYRYRDFQVRDIGRFVRNYTVIETGVKPTVAGQSCTEYSVVSTGRQGAGSFLLAIDDTTGLLLRCEEYDALQALVSKMEYLQYTPQPLLTGIAMHVSDNQEVLLDLSTSLVSQIGFSPDLPQLLPAGYVLAEAASLTDSSGSWLKATYDDGVETLFFLIGPPPAPTASALSSLPTKGSAPVADKIVVHHVGAAVILQGTIGGRAVTVAGKVSETELLDALESSLP